jgi:hypothetical protein
MSMLMDLTLVFLGLVITIEECKDGSSNTLGNAFIVVFIAVQYILLTISIIELLWVVGTKIKSCIKFYCYPKQTKIDSKLPTAEDFEIPTRIDSPPKTNASIMSANTINTQSKFN